MTKFYFKISVLLLHYEIYCFCLCTNIVIQYSFGQDLMQHIWRVKVLKELISVEFGLYFLTILIMTNVLFTLSVYSTCTIHVLYPLFFFSQITACRYLKLLWTLKLPSITLVQNVKLLYSWIMVFSIHLNIPRQNWDVSNKLFGLL